MMSKQRRCDIMTSLLHWYNVQPLREREGKTSSCWKNDTFVTNSWGSLKYDKGLIYPLGAQLFSCVGTGQCVNIWSYKMDNYCLNEHVNLELYKNNVSKLIFKTHAAPFPVRCILGWGCNKK